MNNVTPTAKQCAVLALGILILIVGTVVAQNSDPHLACYQDFERSGYPIRWNDEHGCQAYVADGRWVAAEKLLTPGAPL